MKIKNIRYSLFGLFLALTSVSCIPTKKVVLVEGEASSVKTSDWQHKIEPGDRFYIKITDPSITIPFGQESSTPAEDERRVNLIQQTPTVHDYLVLQDGFIDLPPIGMIKAEGKTISEFTNAIRKECEGYISNPSVKLYMTNFNVTVLGEVNSPGQYQLINNKPDFFDAIGMANDLTDFANRNNIKLIRKNKGELTIHYLDATDPQFINSPFFYLQPNDVIHVMPLKVKKFSSDNAFPLFLSAISALVTIISITSR